MPTENKIEFESINTDVLSAQKNSLNETVLVPTTMLGLGETKTFIHFCFDDNDEYIFALTFF